jgi:sodium/bile acid cotransporter 7
MSRPAYLPDNFVLALLGMVLLASLLPVTGTPALVLKGITTAAISVVFFLQGARLSRQAIVAGLTHWRLHLLVLSGTFVLFPLLGLLLKPLLQPLVTPALYLGVLFLCVLPSTVQSSIALTSLARGNVPAAVCAASASTLLGIALTPWLAGWVLGPQASAAAGVGSGLDAVGKVMLQLLLPFVAGHLLQPWVGGWVKQRARLLKGVDQGSIMLVVYTAFSAAVSEGLWRQVPLSALAGLLLISALLLALALLGMTLVARKLGFAKADEITIVFCGSKKSLASGVPMANVLFPASLAGSILLPVMLFHQLQLMVCSLLAQRLARRSETPD